MSGLLGRWAIVLSGLWLLPLLLIRAQAYDNSDLHALLTPLDVCAAPCFMGIQPGTTTLEQAIALLERQAWVQDLAVGQRSLLTEQPASGAALVNWQWSDTAPAWLEGRASLRVIPRSGQVSVIDVQTNITWGEFVLIFGRPDQVGLFSSFDTLSSGATYRFQYLGWYSQWKLLVISESFCWQGRNLYNWPLRLQFQPTAVDLTSVSEPRRSACR
jgi:hypothetical protein